MTMLLKRDVRCAMCGEKQTIRWIASSHAFGSPDLDLRPPPDQRFLLPISMHRCTTCGYCSNDLEVLITNAQSTMAKPEYQDILHNRVFDKDSNNYRCHAFLCDHADNPANAAWAHLHTAWMMDDHQREEEAKRERSLAADWIFKAQIAGVSFASDPSIQILVLIDLLRRSDRFAEAFEIIEHNKQTNHNPDLLQILQFQEKCIKNLDNGLYTLDEVRLSVCGS